MCMHTLSIALYRELLILEVPVQQQTIKEDLIALKKIHRKAIQHREKTQDTAHSGLFRELLFPFTAFH